MTTAAPPKTPDTVVMARASSVRDSFQKLRRLVVQIPTMQNSAELSQELQDEVADYNADRAGQKDVFSNMVGPVLAMIEQLGDPALPNPEIGALTDQVESTKANRLIALEQAAKTAATGHGIAVQAAEELKPIAARLESDFDGILVDVKDDLERIGQGVSATVAGRAGTNGAAADRQFDVLARLNERSSKAFAAAQDAKNLVRALTQTATNCDNAGSAISKETARVAANEISI